MKRSLPVQVMALVLSVGGLVAQEDTAVPEPEDVVVTVSAKAVPLSVTSSSVSVIDRSEIERSNTALISDLLRTQPALDVIQSGPRGSLTTVSLRGAEENFTLVMIDGIPLNDITSSVGGAVDLSAISLDNVDRIEIVRGPMSSLYGSEALGGVINIITRQGEPGVSVAASGEVGNFESLRAEGILSGTSGPFSFSVGGSFFDISKQVEKDSHRLGTLSATASGAIGSKTSLGGLFRFSDRTSSSFPENGGGPVFSILREPQHVEGEDLLFGVKADHELRDSWVIGVGFDRFERSQQNDIPFILDQIPPGPDTVPSRLGTTDFDRNRFNVSSNWNLSSSVSISASGKIIRENGSSEYVLAGMIPSTFETSRTTGAVGGEVLYVGSRGSLYLGGRFDKGEGFAAEFSPRFGVSFEAVPRFRIKANWGEAFKLPSFFAFSDPLVGNQDLLPERNRGFDLGVEKTWTQARTALGLTYFRNSFRNLIDFSPELFMLVNRTAVVTQGLEAEVTIQPIDSLSLGGHLRYLDMSVRDSDEPLRNRPKWRGGFRVEWASRERWSVSLNSLWVGERFDFQVPVPDQSLVEGYSTVDLSARFRVSRTVELFGRVDNLFDSENYEFIGFPSPGLYARAGLRLIWEK